MINPATFVHYIKDAGIKTEGAGLTNHLTMYCAHLVHISTGWTARVLDYQLKAGLKSQGYIAHPSIIERDCS